MRNHLPDGTDYELTPNYLNTYMSWGAWPMQRMVDQVHPTWATPPWLPEMRDPASAHTTFLIHNLMADGRWPILGPQDGRPQLREYAVDNVYQYYRKSSQSPTTRAC